MKVVSPVRFFDAAMLELARWMAERYVAPLATVLGACRRRGWPAKKHCTRTGPSRTGGALRSFPRLRLGQSPPDPR